MKDGCLGMPVPVKKKKKKKKVWLNELENCGYQTLRKLVAQPQSIILLLP